MKRFFKLLKRILLIIVVAFIAIMAAGFFITKCTPEKVSSTLSGKVSDSLGSPESSSGDTYRTIKPFSARAAEPEAQAETPTVATGYPETYAPEYNNRLTAYTTTAHMISGYSRPSSEYLFVYPIVYMGGDMMFAEKLNIDSFGGGSYGVSIDGLYIMTTDTGIDSFYNSGISIGSITETAGTEAGVIEITFTPDSQYTIVFPDLINSTSYPVAAQAVATFWELCHNDLYNLGYANGGNGSGSGGVDTDLIYWQGFADGEAQGRAEGFQEGYNEGYSYKQEDEYWRGYNEGQVNGKDVGYKQGFVDGKADALSDTYSAQGIFAGAIAFVKLFFQLATQFLNTAIIGDITLGVIVIGLPAAALLLNLVAGFIKKLLGGKGQE